MALEMRARHIAIHCGAAVQEPTPEAAALLLCLFVASAPASYRQFSLSWQDDVFLYVDLSWPLGVAEPGGTAHVGQGRVAFHGMHMLAEHMGHCAAMLNMSVAVHAAPTKHILISRV